MRLLFLGDVVGRPGRAVIIDRLPALIERYKLDFVAVNGENAAGGFGITEEICQNLIDAGADAVTLGNHAFDQREALVFIARQPRLIRPLNYPAGTPGRGANLVMAKNGARVLVMNVLGRVFMDAMDDPFAGVARELDACPLGEQADAVIIDMHAEASSEKQGMGYFADGRASLVVGTHTHVPTADHRILPQGTAFMGDVGMCGDYESMLGMEREEPLQRFQSKISRQRLEPASGPGTLAGVCVDVDDRTGLARHIAPLRLGGVLEEAVPSFWN